MLAALNLVGSNTAGEWEILGSDMVYNYEQVVRQVIYSNQKPAYYLNRQFKIVCSEQNRRFISNEFVETVSKVMAVFVARCFYINRVLQLTVIHPPAAETLVAAAAPARQRVSRQEADLPRAHHQFYTAPGPDQGQYCTLHTKTGLGQ